MDATTLTRLRPADDSHAALRVALSAVAAEREVTMRGAAAARAHHATALTGGTVKDVRRAEDAVREGDILLQQLDVLQAALEARVPAARGADVLASLRAKQARAEALVQRFNEMWPGYAEPARQVAAIMQAEADAIAASTDLMNALRQMHAPAVSGPGGLDIDTAALSAIRPPQVPGVSLGGPIRSSASAACRLPPAADGEPALWWPRT